jgi:hypothetical protein
LRGTFSYTTCISHEIWLVDNPQQNGTEWRTAQ